MNVTPTNQSELTELQALRDRVAQLESELADQAAAANAQIAEAQRRMYWLDKLEVDLNALLSRPWLAFLATVPLKAFRRLRREGRQVFGRLRG